MLAATRSSGSPAAVKHRVTGAERTWGFSNTKHRRRDPCQKRQRTHLAGHSDPGCLEPGTGNARGTASCRMPRTTTGSAPDCSGRLQEALRLTGTLPGQWFSETPLGRRDGEGSPCSRHVSLGRWRDCCSHAHASASSVLSRGCHGEQAP